MPTLTAWWQMIREKRIYFWGWLQAYYFMRQKKGKNKTDLIFPAKGYSLALGLALGKLYFKQKHYKAAEQCFTQALALNPQKGEKVRLLQLLCGVYKQTLNWEEVFNIACAMTKCDAPSVETWNLKGEALLNLGQIKKAEHCFNKALAINAQNSLTLNNLGTCMLLQERPFEAWHFLKLSLGVIPHDPVVLGNAGLALSRAGDQAQAIKYFGEAVKRGLREPFILNNYGVCLAELGRYPEAVRFYRQVLPELNLENDLDSIEILTNIASVFAQAGLHKEALSYYALALKKPIKDAALFNNYALTLASMGHMHEALHYYNLALGLQPDNLKFLENKTVCLEQLEQDEEVMRCLNRILCLEPLNRFAWGRKGAYYARLGKQNQAVDCYNLAWGLSKLPLEEMFLGKPADLPRESSI